MAELNNQPPWSVAGGTTTFIEDLEASLMGSPLNVVPHNLLPEFAFNEDEDALVKSRVLKFCSLKTRTWTILASPDAYEHMSILPFSHLHPNDTNEDDDGVQNCIFTELLSTGQFLSESMYFFSLGVFFYETSFYIF
ncbi:hypothetical protein Hanom_Chr09g00847671 [Helianthus anomalus]